MNFRWREPLGSGPHCPRCGARLKVTPVARECVYCGTVEPTAPLIRAHDSTVLPSLEEQIEEAIVQSDGDPQLRRRFSGFEQPRENNFERYVLIGILVVHGYMLLRMMGRHVNLLEGDAEEFAFLTLALPFFLLALMHGMTFPLLKRLSVVLGPLTALVALHSFLDQRWSAPLWSALPHWLTAELLAVAILTGIWSAFLGRRDADLMEGRRGQ
jgi:hypothetical protein